MREIALYAAQIEANSAMTEANLSDFSKSSLTAYDGQKVHHKAVITGIKRLAAIGLGPMTQRI